MYNVSGISGGIFDENYDMARVAIDLALGTKNAYSNDYDEEEEIEFPNSLNSLEAYLYSNSLVG